ncbi:MFS transporter [Planomonospora parontospora subsp. parontospora]|uniref:MFS transporter n=2 Tax=Planomonospora parontospora TaxID=58119 RepID=A0AA37BF70_9ACTN|nr:MFS transporter [Planomonospora parontospora]GGK61219.1 MFS transporter [Planomonospora parontospora]GII08684.1 MFS transporter [Planomonospora parontospora subsp. parontospora]
MSTTTLARSRSPLIGWLAVTALTLGIFAIVTSEILPIGLLPAIGADYGISDGITGLTMALPGIVAAIAAPAATLTTAHLDRRVMLCILMAVLAVADVLAAVATSYWVMLISRVFVGLTIGGFWSIGAGLAGRLMPPHAVGTATAVIFSAVPLGSVLGVPAGTFIGDLIGWRAAFLVLAVLAILVLAALMLLLPPLPAYQVTSPRVLLDLLRTRGCHRALLATFLIVLAHFGTYTYITPFLQDVAGLPPAAVGAVLLAYGIAGIAGNFLVGKAVATRLRAAFATCGCLIAAATLLLPSVGGTSAGAVVLLVVWGLAYGGVPVCSQSSFISAAPHAPEAATVVFTSSFQATFALGAFLGGRVVDVFSVSTVMICGGLTAVLMALSLWSRPEPR